ncbi:hypothetical protein EDD15DRAFT_1119402 [Pisolithus albus]|nr:hypothetical protein EDD15DRAFT_1119402 [Pisolithus albus]
MRSDSTSAGLRQTRKDESKVWSMGQLDNSTCVCVRWCQASPEQQIIKAKNFIRGIACCLHVRGRLDHCNPSNAWVVKSFLSERQTIWQPNQTQPLATIWQAHIPTPPHPPDRTSFNRYTTCLVHISTNRLLVLRAAIVFIFSSWFALPSTYHRCRRCKLMMRSVRYAQTGQVSSGAELTTHLL